MGTIDYMKVVDIISKTFGAKREVQLDASHDRSNKTDKFDIVMTTQDGGKIPYKIYLFRHELDIIFDKQYFESKSFKKWVSLFEYELEQAMFINIKLNITEDAAKYTIKVIF